MLVIFSILVVALSFVNGLDNGQYNTFVTAEQYTSSVINPNILEDSILSPVELATKYGYTAEIHHVYTFDGYKLEIHRITGTESLPATANKPAVLLQHGIADSSATWVIGGPQQGLAYRLVDQGYDVWLGNFRGNRYSRNHLYLNPDEPAFWNFSFHELGIYDIPSMIDFICLLTGQSKIQYVGHSQGSTTFFVMASERPEYNDRLLSANLLGPVAFYSRLPSVLFRSTNVLMGYQAAVLGINGYFEMVRFNPGFAKFAQENCFDGALLQSMCTTVLDIISGNNPIKNTTLLPVIYGHFPAGSSTKQVYHYGQLIQSARFQQYDYGSASENMKYYMKRTPPKYNLRRITVPVAIHYSENDLLVSTEDTEYLATVLPNIVMLNKVKNPYFTHTDFIWSIEAPYDEVQMIMEQFSK